VGEELRICPRESGCSRLHSRRSFLLNKLCLHCECCDQASQAGKEGSYCSSSCDSNFAIKHAGGNCEGSRDVASQS